MKLPFDDQTVEYFRANLSTLTHMFARPKPVPVQRYFRVNVAYNLHDDIDYMNFRDQIEAWIATYDKLNNDIGDMGLEINEWRRNYAHCRSAHATMARSIKKAIGIENWPYMPVGTFADNIVDLLHLHVSKLRGEIAQLKKDKEELLDEKKKLLGTISGLTRHLKG